MGYSISIRFKNVKQQDEAVSFIRENSEIINKVVSTELIGSSHLPYFSAESFFIDNISYRPKGKRLVGWKQYAISKGLYTFVMWLAFKTEKNYYYFDNNKQPFVVQEAFDEKLMKT